MRLVGIICAMAMLVATISVSGCGHFKGPKKPPPGQIKKHTKE